MKRKISPEESRRILAKVPQGFSFWLCTNQYLRSLGELAEALHTISDDIFRYHVNRDKNDFENWIRDIVQDKELAREIARIKTKETLQRKIEERVEQLTHIRRRALALSRRRRKAKKSRKRTRTPGRKGKTKEKRKKRHSSPKKKGKRRLTKRRKRR